MNEVICITQSRLCDDFFTTLENICKGGADKIILREKQLSEPEYEAYALCAAHVCSRCGVPLSLHSFRNIAAALSAQSFHTSYADFIANCRAFPVEGVSVHSLDEAKTAERLGADYLIAGHIFPTECKKDLPPKGLDFLSLICSKVKIPVYAIGGITPENAGSCVAAGASGICVMSSLMTAENPADLVLRLKAAMSMTQHS